MSDPSRKKMRLTASGTVEKSNEALVMKEPEMKELDRKEPTELEKKEDWRVLPGRRMWKNVKGCTISFEKMRAIKRSSLASDEALDGMEIEPSTLELSSLALDETQANEPKGVSGDTSPDSSRRPWQSPKCVLSFNTDGKIQLNPRELNLQMTTNSEGAKK
eukprot:CAMPEP_0114514782 /NCGR_PEP_ID=MMETSP0109-20121206/16348_1 /TAXON_ID=29199 /ORGANISM="Chlorarachnion reptans, Strain CCCM449" /LENGTH=160 /DNA_ID=CAMNT_0001694867 /DNA_START=156 /DNA_END=638 /DNA_ORIENTATION=-